MRKSSIMLQFLVATMAMLGTACSGKPATGAHARQTEAASDQGKATAGKTATKQEKKNMEVKELTTKEFKEKIMNYDQHPQEWVFEGDKPVIIDFYATWCGPCKATAPIVADIAKAYAGKIDVYKVDVDQQQELASVFGIRSIPTLFFIPKKGNPQVQVGAMNRAQFDEAVKEILLAE